MDYTRMRNATRYRIQRARRLKQYIHHLYMVGQYQQIAATVKQLEQINFLKEQTL